MFSFTLSFLVVHIFSLEKKTQKTKKPTKLSQCKCSTWAFFLYIFPWEKFLGLWLASLDLWIHRSKASFLSKSITGTTSYICSLSFKPFFSINIKTERIFLCHYYIKNLEVSLCFLTGVATTPTSAEYCFSLSWQFLLPRNRAGI